MPLNENTRRHLANMRADQLDGNTHSGFGNLVAKAWSWRHRERMIIAKNIEGLDEIGRGHVRQDEELSPEEADRRTMELFQTW